MTYTPSALFDRTKIKKSIDKFQPMFFRAIDVFSRRIRNNPESIIAWEEITKSRKSVQLIQKGTPAIPVGSQSKAIKYIEPLPIEISKFISAADLNKIKSYTGEQLSDWRTDRLEDLRRYIMNTKNSIAATALNGKIEWKVRLDGGLEDAYEIDFGGISTVATVTGNWQLTTTSLATVVEDINLILEANQDSGYDIDPNFYCGRTTFAALMNKINATTNGSKYQATVGRNMISLMGMNFYNEQFRYWNSAGTATRAIADTEIRLIDLGAEHETINMPVDDIENMRPVAIGFKPVITEDPSGIKLIARSNPVYIPVADAIKKATVTV